MPLHPWQLAPVLSPRLFTAAHADLVRYARAHHVTCDLLDVLACATTLAPLSWRPIWEPS